MITLIVDININHSLIDFLCRVYDLRKSNGTYYFQISTKHYDECVEMGLVD